MERICPNCKKKYKTDLDRPVGDDRSIQDIFPNATADQREQLVSGICSDRCWREYLGPEE